MWKQRKGAINPDMTDTLIGEGTVIEGNLHTQSSIRIEGRVNGDIECAGDVTIGEKGAAFSNVHARSVLNAGMIQGSVRVKDRLAITKTGKVFGSILVPSLHVAEGGILEGTSRMDAKSAQEHKPEKERPHGPKSDKIAAVK